MSSLRLLASALLAVSMAAGVQEAPPARIIDVHMHAYTNDPRFGTRFTNPITGQEMVASPGPDGRFEANLEPPFLLSFAGAAQVTSEFS